MFATSESPVTLVVPADHSFVRVVRLVVSSLAADMDFDFEEVEDLRIVTDELISAAIAAAAIRAPLHVRLTSIDDALCLEASVAATDDAPGVLLDPLAAQIVEALVEGFAVGVADASVTVSFRSHRPAGARRG